MAAGPMQRGSNVDLTREIPTLTGVVLGVTLTSPEPVLSDNLVVAALLCDARSRVLSDEHMVFFNQLTEPAGSVTRRPDSSGHDGGGRSTGHDTEQIEVDLTAVPPEVERIVLVSYINEALGSRRALGQLREASVRVLNLADDTELVRSENLAPALSAETGVVLGELYRYQRDWKFKVIGQGYVDGIRGVAADFGIRL